MRIAIVSDVHVGNHKIQGGAYERGINQRCTETIDVLNDAVTLAIASGCESFIVAGDLFDTSKPPPQMIAEVASVLCGRGIRVILLSGNHDQSSSQEGDNALAPFKAMGGAVVIDGVPHKFGDLLCVPFSSDLSAEDMKGYNATVIIMHVGIEDDATPPWLKGHGIRYEEIAERMGCMGARFCFSGDWHTPNKWTVGKREIYQCGALVPTGYDNPGAGYGKMYILDTDAGVSVVELEGPRFFKTTDRAEALTLLKKPLNYVRLITDSDGNPRLLSSDRRLSNERPIAERYDIRDYEGNATIAQAVDSWFAGLSPSDAIREPARRRCRSYLGVG